MKNISKLSVLNFILLLTLAAVGGSYLFDGAKTSEENKEKFGEQVRAYLLQNPVVIREAIEVLTAHEQRAEAEKKRLALAGSKADLENDGFSFVAGNPDGDVTIVEFFDYRCGYCKQAFPTLMKTVNEDGNIRLVLKEFPILGDQSILAAQAVMAAQIQGKYKEFHDVLMTARGSYTKDKILGYAAEIGLDTDQLESDMKSDIITSNIRKNYNLARALGISGTPAFVIGGTLVPGAIPADQMKTMVADARARNSATATN